MPPFLLSNQAKKEAFKRALFSMDLPLQNTQLTNMAFFEWCQCGIWMLLILLEDISMGNDIWLLSMMTPTFTKADLTDKAKMKLWNARLSKLTFAIQLVNFPSASVAFLMKTKWAATRHKWQQPLIYRMQKVPTPLTSSTFNEKGSILLQ